MPTFAAASEGETYTPPQAGGARKLVKQEPNAHFTFAVHPMRWDVFEDEDCILPVLRPIRHVDGVEAQNGGAKRQSIASAEEKGWTIIPHRYGPGGESYVKRHRVRGGYYHCGPHEKVFPGTGIIRSDVEGYRAWLKGLIAKGVITKPPAHILEVLRERCEAKAEDYEKRDSPRARANAERFRKALAVWDAEIEQAVGALEPAEGEAASESEGDAGKPAPKKRGAK